MPVSASIQTRTMMMAAVMLECLSRFAPYVALFHERLVGDTADRAEAEGDGVTEALVKVGLRMWF